MGAGAGVTDQVRSGSVLAEIADGATVVLQGLHRLWPPLIDLGDQLAVELGHPTQVNAYITPPGNRGFDAHYDTHDVLVIQTSGRKHWTVHAPVVPLPGPSDPWTGAPRGGRRRGGGRAAHRHRARAWRRARTCPRGYLHSARAADGTSCHLTVGIHPLTGVTVAEGALALLGELAAADPDLRAALPLGVDAGDPGQTRDAVTATMERMRALLDALDPAEVADRLRTAAWSQVRPAPVRPLTQAAALADARPRRTCSRSGPGCGCASSTGDPPVLLAGQGRFPLDHAEADAVRAWLKVGVLDRRRPRRAWTPTPRWRWPGAWCSTAARSWGESRPPQRAGRAGSVRTVARSPRWTVATPSSGTAVPQSRWLLVEQPGPWGRAGHQPVPLRRVRGAGPGGPRRRRGGAHHAGPAHRAARPPRAAGCGGPTRTPGRPSRGLWWHARQDDREILDAPWDGSGGALAPSPTYLVCAHAGRDACCAVRGRPLAASLPAPDPLDVWECSHTGGDRFAANLLTLPYGDLYGRVPGDGAGSSPPPSAARCCWSTTAAAPVSRRRSRSPLRAARRGPGALGVDDLAGLGSPTTDGPTTGPSRCTAAPDAAGRGAAAHLSPRRDAHLPRRRAGALVHLGRRRARPLSLRRGGAAARPPRRGRARPAAAAPRPAPPAPPGPGPRRCRACSPAACTRCR